LRAARRFPAGCRYCVRSHTAAARKGGMTDAMLGMLTTTPHAMGHAACSQTRPASLLMRVCPAVPRGRRAAGGGGDVQRDKPPRPGPSSSQLPGSEIKWLQPQRISRFHLCVVLCCVFVFVFIFVLPVPRDMQAYDVPVDPMFLAEPRPSTVSTAAAEELLDVSTMYHNKTFRAVSNDASG